MISKNTASDYRDVFLIRNCHIWIIEEKIKKMSKSIKLNTIFKTLMSIVNIVFPLLTVPYVARVLSMDGYTEYNKAVSMITWFSPFAVFGVYTYGMRTVSQIKNDKQAVSKLFSKLFVFSIFFSVGVTVVYLIVISFLPSFQGYRGMYAIISTQLLFICFATDWANEAYENYGFILIKTFFCRLLYVIFVFVFVKKAEDVLIYVFLTSLSVMLNNVLTFVYTKSKIRFSRFLIKEEIILIKPLFTVFLLVNSSMLYTVFDRFVLTWFGNKLLLTYYNISQTIVLAVVNVTSSVLLVSIPRLSFFWADDKKGDYHTLLNKTSDTFMALHTPCCIGLACISTEIIYYYSGMNYIAASLPFSLFSLRYYLSAFDMILAKQVLLVTGNEKVLTKVYYIGGVYNVVAKIVLVLLDKLTPELCIITTATADILVIILQLMSIEKLKIQFKIFSKSILKYLVTSLLFIPMVMTIKYLIPFNGIELITLRTLLSIIACVFIYVAMLFFTKDYVLLSVIMRRKNEKKLFC